MENCQYNTIKFTMTEAREAIDCLFGAMYLKLFTEWRQAENVHRKIVTIFFECTQNQYRRTVAKKRAATQYILVPFTVDIRIVSGIEGRGQPEKKGTVPMISPGAGKKENVMSLHCLTSQLRPKATQTHTHTHTQPDPCKEEDNNKPSM